ncbi:MAG: hypothetical protein HYU37_17250 [Acidobacteria bacterium]|nr:hypothetical protein [Acidobacteriota bacterium]
MTRTLRLVATGVILWAVTAVAYGTVRLTFGPRPVYVNVRWADGVDAAARQRLEQRYGLADGELREGTTWGYALTDRSRTNIRALVEDPAVADTHQIHRTAFRVGYFAERLPYRSPYAWVALTLETIALAGLILGTLVLALALVDGAAPALVRGPLRVLRDAVLAPRARADDALRAFLVWIRGRIPSGSPEAAALFRIVFGTGLLLFLLRRPVRGAMAVDPSNAISDIHRALLQIFVAVPWLAGWIGPWLVCWGVLFIVGARARLAFGMLTLGAFLWALLFTTQTTYHTVSALLVTLLCLQWGRWSDRWSVDAWRRQRTAAGPTRPALRDAQEYGYTFWVPSFVLGVVYLAAALAKLRDGGLAWILNGTVKYHFLSDSPQAMVDWGLRLGRYHWVAVFLSFSAIAIESLVIAGALARAYRYRALAGLSALCLVSGFSLLQGLLWPGWWLLLLSFLPWHLVPSRDATRPWRQALAGPAPVAVVVSLIAAQSIVSLLRIEVSPLISAYDMYATTYASPAEYEQKAGEQYWLVADADTTPHECRISRADVDVLGAASKSSDSERTREVLQRCFDAPVRFHRVSVEARRARVDWQAWKPATPARTQLFSIAVTD